MSEACRIIQPPMESKKLLRRPLVILLHVYPRLTPNLSTTPGKLSLGHIPSSHFRLPFPRSRVSYGIQHSFVVRDRVYALYHRGTPTCLPGTVPAVLGLRPLTIKFSNGCESRYHADRVKWKHSKAEAKGEDDFPPSDIY